MTVAGVIGGSNCYTKVSALTQLVSFVSIPSSSKFHNNNFIQFSSRLSTFRSRPITSLLSIKQFSRSSYTCNNCSICFEEEEEDYNNNNNNANTSSSSYDRIGGSLSSLSLSSSSSSSSSSSLSSSSRSCSCNCQHTSPTIQINIVFPNSFQFCAMLAHVYSKLHPLLDQFTMSMRHGSMFFFQVAVSDKERGLRRMLNKIAENGDTSTLNGLNYAFKEVVKALLQYSDSSIHFTKLCAEWNFMKSLSKNFEEFLNTELESHGKYENTLVNVDGNVDYKNKASMVKAYSSIENEYTVVTLLVLASGKHMIPPFKGKGAIYDDSYEVLQTKKRRCHDCFQVLQTLQRIPKNEIQSIEVLWSPRKEDEVLLENELLRDFPRLRRIKNGLICGTFR